MKATLILLLSLLLTMAITMPAVLTLMEIGNDTTSFFDFNEEENNKEDSKEVNQKVFFAQTVATLFASSAIYKAYAKVFYVECEYTNNLEVFLPPPKNA